MPNSVPSSRSGLPINVAGTSPIYHTGSTSGVKTNRKAFIPTMRQLRQIDGSSAPEPVTPAINRGAVSPVRGTIAGFGSVKPVTVARKPGKVMGGASPNATAQTSGAGAGAGAGRSGGARGIRTTIPL